MRIAEILPPSSALAFKSLVALRPQLKRASFETLIDTVQRPEGYRLIGVFEPDREDAVAVAGFRVVNSTAWGRALYVDDLSTLPEARRRGHARALLGWLADEGSRLGCAQLHLDSGVGPDRADAHRLYLNYGMQIAAHHFARRL